MKMPTAAIRARFIPAISFLVCLLCAGIAHAQVPETPEQAAHSPFSPAEQAWRKAQVVCRLQFHQNNLPNDQRDSFMTSCMQAEGLVDPPPITQAANPTANAQQK
jgi:hypothetical protein